MLVISLIKACFTVNYEQLRGAIMQGAEHLVICRTLGPRMHVGLVKLTAYAEIGFLAFTSLLNKPL